MSTEPMRTPLRVLIVADCVGGVWPFALELARGLLHAGDTVALATLGAPLKPHQRDEVASLAGLHPYEGGFRLLWMRDPWDDVARAGEWLHAVAHDFRPDVVHCNDFGNAAQRWPAPMVLTAHSCVLSWWRAVHGAPAPDAQWRRYRDTVQRALRAAQRVIAPTRAMIDALAREYDVRGVPQVIPNGRTPPESLSMAGKRPIVFSAGRLWDEAKNLAALVDVAPGLSWPLHVAGDAGDAPWITDAAHVRLLGELSREEMDRCFARASIYAAPARYEPFGLAALEAAQAGCALVLGDIPSLREVWADAALYVPPADRAALRDTLQRLIDDDGLRRAMAQRAYLRAARYRAGDMVARYRRVFDAVRRRPGFSAPRTRDAVRLSAGGAA